MMEHRWLARLRRSVWLTALRSRVRQFWAKMTHQRHTLFKVMNQEFWVDNKFRITKELGQGAYGIVWYLQTGDFPTYGSAAKAIDTGESVAVKKVCHVRDIPLIVGHQHLLQANPY